MSTTVEDMLGNQVGEGDQIVYGATDGRSAGLRLGTVKKITPAGKVPYYKGSDYLVDKPAKITVEVHKSTGYWTPGKPTVIDASLKRFLLLRAADYEVLAAVS